MPNKKRNVIEMLISQPESGYMLNKFHVIKFNTIYQFIYSKLINEKGDVKVLVQEWDGGFIHDIKVDYPSCKFDLPFASKGRRSKRRTIKIAQDQTVEIDSHLEEPESPVLWILVDPEFNHCLDLDIKQVLDFMSIYYIFRSF